MKRFVESIAAYILVTLAGAIAGAALFVGVVALKEGEMDASMFLPILELNMMIMFPVVGLALLIMGLALLIRYLLKKL